MGEVYTARCGCQFPVLGKNGDLTKLDVTLIYRDINYFCPATWELLQSGNTKGIFQLETQFAQSFSEKLGPENLDHLSALGAILRPGPLKSGMADAYIDRKNGKEEAEPFDKSLEEILSSTYQVLVFQEQAIRIGIEIGGFDPAKADLLLRKGIGKKKAELIEQAKVEFLKGAKEVGLVNEEQAKAIFGWIETGARYSFNACLCPNTIVELENGEFITLSELKIGDKIMSHTGPTEVKNVFDQGMQEVYKITLESGKEIECTLSHKFKCEDGKIRSLENIIENGHKIMCEEEI
jgi:DNA polymerase-3 subunit alpha